MDVLLGAYLLRYTLLGLLDTFFLRWVAHTQVTKSVHQLIVGWVQLQGRVSLTPIARACYHDAHDISLSRP